MINSVIKTCRDFVEKVLEKEDWFCRMVRDKACDLLLLTGTAMKRERDFLSDVDIFIVCPYKMQIKYQLKPVRLYNYKGKNIELSTVSTEKLSNDQYNKENLYWWHGTQIIKSYNKKIEITLRKATALSKKEFLDRLWTNFVRFEINSFDIEKQIKRNEPLSVNLLFNENIKLVADAALVSQGQFPQYKWFGGILKQKNSKLYKELLLAQQIQNFEKIKLYNKKLRNDLMGTLKTNGFTNKEFNNWENCNLERITFQYR